MRNESFTDLTLREKKNRVSDIINAKTKKRLSRGLISNVVENICLERQLGIVVVNKETLRQVGICGQYITLDLEGRTTYMCNVFCRVEFGEFRLGKIQSITRGDIVLQQELIQGECVRGPIFLTRVEEVTKRETDGTVLSGVKNTLYIAL